MKIFVDFIRKHLVSVIIFDLFIVLLIILLLGLRVSSFAQANSSEKFSCDYPCAKIFTITAYYSPQPNQLKYLTGSYEKEKRLNGDGVHGADGTDVYPGMIAAPSYYSFGLKMDIPGIGITTVHDRGGAIVKADDPDEFDRLDIWMGYGDEGLTRALTWGKRNLEVNILGLDKTIEDSVYLEGYSETEKIISDAVPIFQAKYYKNDLGYGDTGDEVKRLQENLKAMGYYIGELTAIYDDQIFKSILKFQLDNKIIDDANEFGAGYFGPNTRKTFDYVWERAKKEEDDTFSAALGPNSPAENVKKIQKILKELGFLEGEIDGVYDIRTIEAIFKFQIDKKLVSQESDTGAGYLGPKTRAALKIAWTNEEKPVNGIVVTREILAKYPDLNEEKLTFNRLLAFGDSGEDVEILQTELSRLGYLKVKATGYYGMVTKHSVFKLQQAWGLIKDETEAGAGMLGPNTRAKFNLITQARLDTKKLIAAKREEKSIAQKTEEKVVAVNNKVIQVVNDLAAGDRGEEVKKLQELLQKTGFLKTPIITDYYGENTKKAVLAFQLNKGIVKSASDTGAGRVGPKTREELVRL